MKAALHRVARLLACASTAAVLLAGCGGKSEEDLTASGKKLMADKDLPGAIILFKSALQKAPNMAEARLMLGKALLEAGDPVAALVELRKAQELGSPDDEAAPVLARAMLLMGDGAKVLLRDHYRLGEFFSCNDRDGDWSARLAFRTALRRDHDFDNSARFGAGGWGIGCNNRCSHDSKACHQKRTEQRGSAI